MIRVLSLLSALILAATLTVSAQCSTCYVASNIDSASTSYLAGWGFACGYGSPLAHFDAYYYTANGTLVRLTDAYIINGLWREDVYHYFLNGGGCPSVPITSGWHIYFPTPPPAGSTVVLTLWHGWIYNTQYVTVN